MTTLPRLSILMLGCAVLSANAQSPTNEVHHQGNEGRQTVLFSEQKA